LRWPELLGSIYFSSRENGQQFLVLFDRTIWLIWAFAGSAYAWYLASGSDCRGLLCGAAVPHFQLPWTLVSRHCRGCRFDGCAHPVLKIWHPKQLWLATERPGKIVRSDAPEIEARIAQSEIDPPNVAPSRSDAIKGMTPGSFCGLCFSLGSPAIKAFSMGSSGPKFPVAGLDKLVQKMPPSGGKPSPEAAVYSFGILSATGKGSFWPRLSWLVMGFSAGNLLRAYWRLSSWFGFTGGQSPVCSRWATYSYSGTDAAWLAFAQTALFIRSLALCSDGWRCSHWI